MTYVFAANIDNEKEGHTFAWYSLARCDELREQLSSNDSPGALHAECWTLRQGRVA